LSTLLRAIARYASISLCDSVNPGKLLKQSDFSYGDVRRDIHFAGHVEMDLGHIELAIAKYMSLFLCPFP